MEESEISYALQNLVQLQRLDLRVGELRDRISKAPTEMEELDQDLAEALQEVEEAEVAISAVGNERKYLENRVEELRGKLSHYKDQLMGVKTNTEYQAMLKEIEFVEQKIAQTEDEILEQMLEAEELNDRLKQAKARLNEQTQAIETRKKELKVFVEDSKTEVASLEEEKQRVASQIPQEYVARFNRIAAVRGGMAVAEVVGHCCQACHVRLRPQLLAEVRSNRQILLCENCNRILYFPAP